MMQKQPYFTARISDSLHINYTDNLRVNAPVILFIHGLANYLHVWDLNVQSLQAKFRCIAIDLPGNGLSSRGNFDYDLPFYSTCILDFIELLGLKNVNLCGHSMGGQIACYTAINHPERVKNLILCAPAGFEYYTNSEAILFKSAIAFGDFLNMDEVHISQSIHTSFYKITDLTHHLINDLQKLIQKHDRAFYRKMLDKSISAMLGTPIFQDLKKISCPCLVFFGENDMLIPNRFLHPYTTKEIAEKACAEIKDVNLVMYKNTGHFVHIERSNEVNTAIDDFLMKTN